MATIIETSPDRFIVGDPPAELGVLEHWCDWCAGSGLEHGWDGELDICHGCLGMCTRSCDDLDCAEHAAAFAKEATR